MNRHNSVYTTEQRGPVAPRSRTIPAVRISGAVALMAGLVVGGHVAFAAGGDDKGKDKSPGLLTTVVTTVVGDDGASGAAQAKRGTSGGGGDNKGSEDGRGSCGGGGVVGGLLGPKSTTCPAAPPAVPEAPVRVVPTPVVMQAGPDVQPASVPVPAVAAPPGPAVPRPAAGSGTASPVNDPIGNDGLSGATVRPVGTALSAGSAPGGGTARPAGIVLPSGPVQPGGNVPFGGAAQPDAVAQSGDAVQPVPNSGVPVVTGANVPASSSNVDPNATTADAPPTSGPGAGSLDGRRVGHDVASAVTAAGIAIMTPAANMFPAAAHLVSPRAERPLTPIVLAALLSLILVVWLWWTAGASLGLRRRHAPNIDTAVAPGSTAPAGDALLRVST